MRPTLSLREQQDAPCVKEAKEIVGARSQRRALRDAADRSTRRLVEQQTQRHPMTVPAKKGKRKTAPKRSSAVTGEEIAQPGLNNIEPCHAPSSTGKRRAGALTVAATPPVEKETADACVTPLEYRLSVMRDPAVEAARRDEMAKLALPYLHPKPTAAEHSCKNGGPIEITDVSETDIARRIGFMMASEAREKTKR
jgi:hypothetical protein